jgi:hypothetical protein
VIQLGREGAVLTLEKLGVRWGWEKTTVWRFFQKHGDIFPLRKLPGSYGCLVFSTRGPLSPRVYICSAKERKYIPFVRWPRRCRFDCATNPRYFVLSSALLAFRDASAQ